MTSSEFSNEDMKNTFLKKKKSDLVIANYSKYLNMWKERTLYSGSSPISS